MAKLREVEERRLTEAQIRVANEAEAKAQADRRLHLKAITEEDRELKKIQKTREDNSKCAFGHDIIGKNLANRVTHEAYDRRAKQDNIINYMADKFTIGERQGEKDRLVAQLANADGFNK